MRETIRLSLRLFAFAVIAALLLALTNEVTKGPIAAQAVAAANAARKRALPEADSFMLLAEEPIPGYPDIREVCVGKRGGETVGYTFLVAPQGYKAEIIMTLGVNRDGSVSALAVNSIAETAGLGSKVADEDFLMQFSGSAADPQALTDVFDAVSGATVSSKAVLKGLNEATAYSSEVLGIRGHARDGESADEFDEALLKRFLESVGDDEGLKEAMALYERAHGGED